MLWWRSCANIWALAAESYAAGPVTLTIFPEGGLASSVITTVWVGVFVLCFFNLRL